MTSFESEAIRVINKFNGGNLNLWKFKIKTLLAFMDIWDIVDGSYEASTFNVDDKMLKEYQRRIKNTIFKGANWRMTNLHTSTVAKDPRRHRKPFATFTRRRVCPTLFLFTASSLCARYKKMMTCWTMHFQ